MTILYPQYGLIIKTKKISFTYKFFITTVVCQCHIYVYKLFSINFITM